MYCDSAFRAPWWLTSPVAQTLQGWRLRRHIGSATGWRTRALDDSRCWLEISPPGNGALLLLVPGLPWPHNAVDGIALALHRAGLAVAVLHSPALLASEHDVDCAVERLLRDHPSSLFGLCGLSLGGAVALNWLAGQGARFTIQAAAAASPVLRPDLMAEQLDSRRLSLLRRPLLRSWKEAVVRHYGRQLPRHLIARLQAIDSVERFNTLVGAPLHGHATASSWYTHLACNQPRLAGIGCPTLVLQARDDPLTPHSSLPPKGTLSRYVTVELSTQGGHLGFIEGGWPWRQRGWMEERLAHWFANRLR